MVIMNTATRLGLILRRRARGASFRVRAWRGIRPLKLRGRASAYCDNEDVTGYPATLRPVGAMSRVT